MLKQKTNGVWLVVLDVAHRFRNIAERIAALAPLREVLEPKPHKWQPGFKLEGRAHISTKLHPKEAQHWEKSIRKAARSKGRAAARRRK